MELVAVVPRGLSHRPVDGDAVPDLILNDQHPQVLQLFAQVLDIVADDPVVDVHVGAVVEYVQAAGHIDFQGGSNEMGLLFVLRQQGVVQVLQDGGVLRAWVVQVLPVHQPDAAVDHCFLHRLEADFAAHHDVAK